MTDRVIRCEANSFDDVSRMGVRDKRIFKIMMYVDPIRDPSSDTNNNASDQ